MALIMKSVSVVQAMELWAAEMFGKRTHFQTNIGMRKAKPNCSYNEKHKYGRSIHFDEKCNGKCGSKPEEGHFDPRCSES